MPHQNDPTPPGHRKEKNSFGGNKAADSLRRLLDSFSSYLHDFWARASGDIGFSLRNSRELGFRCPDHFEIN
jgi:hypothetical protein